MICAVIDWTEVCYQSLTIDVSTCLYSTLSKDTLSSCEDDLILYYIQALNHQAQVEINVTLICMNRFSHI